MKYIIKKINGQDIITIIIKISVVEVVINVVRCSSRKKNTSTGLWEIKWENEQKGIKIFYLKERKILGLSMKTFGTNYVQFFVQSL